MSLFPRRQLLIFFIVFITVLIVSLGITITVSLAKQGKFDKKAVITATDNRSGLTFNDFLIPKSYYQPWRLKKTLSREPMETWDKDTADRFEQDIPGIVLEIIQEENTKRLLEGK